MLSSGLVFVLITVLGAGFALLTVMRQKNALQAILQEGAKGYDSLRSRALYLEKSLTTLESQVVEAKKREEATRFALSEMSQRAYQAEADLDLKTKDFERRFRNVELQRDHMITQHDHVLGAINDTHQEAALVRLELSDLKLENERLAKEAQDANIKAAQKLRQENVELRKKLTDKEHELRLIKGRSDINPRDFDTLRRKVGQYEMLYTGMKSQRDMVDERNRNWESALERMSRWILTKSPLARSDDPILNAGVGPMVGEALSRIGMSLLEIAENEEREEEKRVLSDDKDLIVGAARDSSESTSRLS